MHCICALYGPDIRVMIRRGRNNETLHVVTYLRCWCENSHHHEKNSLLMRLRKKRLGERRQRSAQPGSNRSPLNLQSNALPLSYAPINTIMGLWLCSINLIYYQLQHARPNLVSQKSRSSPIPSPGYIYHTAVCTLHRTHRQRCNHARWPIVY